MEKGAHPYGMKTFQISVAKLLEQGFIDDQTANEAMGT